MTMCYAVTHNGAPVLGVHFADDEIALRYAENECTARLKHRGPGYAVELWEWLESPTIDWSTPDKRTTVFPR